MSSVVAAAIILSLAAFAGIFAYIAINLGRDGGELTLLNYSLAYFLFYVLLLVSIQAINTGQVSAGFLTTFSIGYLLLFLYVLYVLLTEHWVQLSDEVTD